jgi:hypothetical protein
MKCKKKYDDGGEVPNEDDPKKKKKRYRGGKSSDASVDFNVTSDSGLRGSCEDGNLRACKTKVVKKKKFNPFKRVISRSRIVRSKPEEEEERIPNSTGNVRNPRYL